MRKLNLPETNDNIRDMAKRGELYSFYGLTENSDFDKYEELYVTERFRFSIDGNRHDLEDKKQMFLDMLYFMQETYIKTMNINSELFRVNKLKCKIAPYNTIVIDMEVEGVKGAFHSIVNCAGPDAHQFHASDIWVRANKKAEVWKSLFDKNGNFIKNTNTPFAFIIAEEAEKWLEKVKDARNIAKECIKTTGEPSDKEKKALFLITQR